MTDSEKPEHLENVNLAIQGNEDLTIRPWRGPAPQPMPEGAKLPASAGHGRESHYALIAAAEDLAVQPWQPATSPERRNGAAPVGLLPLRLEDVEGVTIVGFDTSTITDELSDRFVNFVAGRGHTRLLLNLSNVQYMSSHALGELIKLRGHLRAAHGEMKLCCIHPDLLEILRVTRLDQVFTIHEEQQKALDEFRN